MGEKEDQKFVSEAKAHYSSKNELAAALADHFSRQYKLDLHITRTESEWVISSLHRIVRVHYAESVPSAVRKIVSG